MANYLPQKVSFLVFECCRYKKDADFVVTTDHLMKEIREIRAIRV